MSTNRRMIMISALCMGLFLCGGDTVGATELRIFGFEGTLQQADVANALTEIKGLRIGLPPFLKDLRPTDSGIEGAWSALLRKGRDEVRLFELKFETAEQAIASLNLETQAGPSDRANPYTIEDPNNCRNQDFGLFFDGVYWSGFRRNSDVLAIMKGDITREDMFHLMEEVFRGR